jgi:hypothetical protein
MAQMEQLDHRVYRAIQVLQVQLEHKEPQDLRVFKVIQELLAHKVLLVLQEQLDHKEPQVPAAV